MLSALIKTEGSYSAMPLAGQSIHQSFVIPGPLVMYSSLISKCIDYIFTLCSAFVKRNEFGVGVGILWEFNQSRIETFSGLSGTFHISLFGISRYGVKPSIFFIRAPVWRWADL